MRIAFHYLFAVLVLTVYGGQVRPFMDSLPPVGLGVIILVPFAAAFLVRGFLERSLVLSAPPPAQPER